MMSMMMGASNYNLIGATALSTSPIIEDSLLMQESKEPMASSPGDGCGSPGSSTGNDSPNRCGAGPSSPPNLRGVPKECGVCGDVAKSMHFGGLSCDSCKAFFRRSVQNNAYKGFSCPYEKHCFIGVSSRKACQYCRFEKCVSIGMEKSWVMTEDERRRMMQQRQEKKIKQAQEETYSRPVVDNTNESFGLSEEDRAEICLIESLYKRAYSDIPYEENYNPNGDCASGPVIGPWMTFCKRMAYFFSLFKDFAELESGDQFLLLKTAITSAGIIMGSVVYDSTSGKWSARTIPKLEPNAPDLALKNMEGVVPHDLIVRVDKFFRKFQNICPDETMAMILILVSLYSPELMGLRARETVQSLQDRYIHILHHYVKFKYKERSTMMFPKAIVSLADIRELADRTCQMQIKEKIPPSLLKGTLMSGAVNSHDPPCLKATKGPYNPLTSDSSSKRAHLTASGGGRDMIYQKIIEMVMDHMHASVRNIRSPSLLPILVQMVQKLSRAHEERSGRAIAGSSSHRRSHYHPKMHRLGHKRRLVEVKQEVAPNQLLPVSQPFDEVTIKNEVMETDSNDDYYIPSGPSASEAPNTFGTSYSSIEYRTNSRMYPVLQGPIDHYNPKTNEIPDSHPYGVRSPHERDSHTVAQVESTNHMVHEPTHHSYTHHSDYHQALPNGIQKLTELLPVNYSYSHEVSEHPNSSASGSSFSGPGSSYMVMRTADVPSSILEPSGDPVPMQIVPHTPQMSPNSPFTPPTSSLSPPMTTSTVQPYVSQPSPGPVLSPYSSTSSSSSPEDYSQESEFFSPNFTDIEKDVLTQLMNILSSVQNLDNVSINEALPPQLLTELNKQLLSFKEASSNQDI